MKKLLINTMAVAMLAASAQVAKAMDEITVAYFLEWPMPMMASKASGAYDEALGMKVKWVSFETGTAMSAAMASGDVQIAVSQGVPPFRCRRIGWSGSAGRGRGCQLFGQ